MKPLWILLLAALPLLGESATTPAPTNSASIPAIKNPWMDKHDLFVATARKGDVDLLFVGDSITEGWNKQKLFKERYVPLKAANFGISGDRTENVLWRLKNGELEGIKPRVVVLLIGTNNVHNNTAPEITEGIRTIIREIQSHLPESKILLLGIFPRSATPDAPERQIIREVNAGIARLEDGVSVRFLNFGDKFLQPDGSLSKEVMPDFLHLSEKGYRIWMEAMQHLLDPLMGDKPIAPSTPTSP